MAPSEIFGVVSGAWGMAGVTVGGAVGAGVGRWKNRKASKRYRDGLRAASTAGELALCLSVGGTKDPEKDLVAYLKESQPALESFLYYATPDGADLANPDMARRVCDDLTALLREVGRERTPRLHLFLNGMLAYPFLVGALAGNTTPVVVYYFDTRATPPTYLPLYEWRPADAHTARITAPLGTWRSIACPTPPATGSPLESSPTAPPAA